MRNRSLIMPLAILATIAVAPDVTAAEEKALSSDDAKIAYALGMAISERVRPFALTPEEVADLQKGLADGVLGRESLVDMAVYGPQIEQLLRRRTLVAAETEKKLGQEFLKTVSAEKGSLTTDSGLIYLELQPGNGETPKTTDTVKLHYHGTLRDGSVFDSSVEKGEPATFALNRVIPCFSEGVSKMKTGGKSRIVCPSDIAYGDQGSPPKVPGGAVLSFEIDLLEIVKSQGPASK